MTNHSEQRLLIRVGQVVFGVPALASEGILAMPAHVTALPGARTDEPGVFHHGNGTVALVDLRRKLGLEAGDGRLVLARAAGALRGFVVDEVPGFASPEARAAPLPPGLPLRTFQGALLHGERLALLTDFEALYALAEAGPALRQLAQPAPAEPEAPPPAPHVPLHEALGKVISEGRDRAPPAARSAPPPPATIPTPAADTARTTPRAAASRPARAPTAPVSAKPAPTPRSGASTLSRKPAVDKTSPPRPPATPAKEVLTHPASTAPAPSPAPKPAHDPGPAPAAPRALERATSARTRLLPYAVLAALVAGVVVALPFVLSPPREVRAPALPPMAEIEPTLPEASVAPVAPPPAPPQETVPPIAALPPEASPLPPPASEVESSVRIEATEEGVDVVVERHAPASEVPASTGRAEAPPTPTVRETVSVHTVVRGDTLWDIATRYLNDPWAYPQLAADSRIEDPDIIEVGDKVRVVVREISNGSR